MSPGLPRKVLRWLGNAGLTLALGAGAITMSIILTTVWTAATTLVPAAGRDWLVTGLWAITFIPAFVLTIWAGYTGRWKVLFAVACVFAVIPLALLALVGGWNAQILVPLFGAREWNATTISLTTTAASVASWVLAATMLAVGAWHFRRRSASAP